MEFTYAYLITNNPDNWLNLIRKYTNTLGLVPLVKSGYPNIDASTIISSEFVLIYNNEDNDFLGERKKEIQLALSSNKIILSLKPIEGLDTKVIPEQELEEALRDRVTSINFNETYKDTNFLD
ncbi:MAG: hypothetical protein ISS82_04215 [Nanoarchaeota archaeon]|nr:hypothetical protein [Nanoarchaeota archaeon]